MDFRTLINKLFEDVSDDPFNGNLPPKIKVMSLQDFVQDETVETDAITEDPDKFLGASLRKLSNDELKSYLDRVITKEKEPTDKYKLPYIHRGSVIPIVDKNNNEYDLDALRRLFTQRPDKILKQNEKMKHSDGSTSVFYNVGLPALLGLAVDEKSGEFYVVDTCPGAGSCKIVCFAKKGGYVQWEASSLSQTRLLNYLLNDPDGFMSQLKKEVKQAVEKNTKKKNDVYIRWHDAGDFFSPAYVNKAFELAKEIPDATFYAYTKIADVVKSTKPDNFVINFSMGAKGREEKKVDFKKDKHSVIVPKELYMDYVTRKEMPTGKKDKDGKPKTASKMIYKSTQAIKDLKQKIAGTYDIDVASILTYDEMLKASKGSTNQYNVIVKPGDGDISATRRDVLGTYLLEH
jgi:hypothetical protein